VSAVIIQFAPRPSGRKGDDAPIPFRSPVGADDLVMDHADTAPCEHWPTCAEGDDDHA